MQALTSEEMAAQLKCFDDVGEPSDYVHADDHGLFFNHPEAACIHLEYPEKLELLPFFAHAVATVGYEDQHFDGALLWFCHWGVWNLFNEGVGYRIIEKMNLAAGRATSFETAPGHRFRADELSDAIGMLLQPMIFAWDSFYLPSWSYGTGDFFLRISHHSNVTVVTRTKEFHQRAFKQLDEFHMNPKPASAERVDRFCRPR